MRWKGMFSSKERRGILILLPALLVSAWVVRRALSPHADEAARPYVDAAFAADRSGRSAVAGRGGSAHDGTVMSDTLFVFDPNTVDFHSLMRLGFTRQEALGIIKYRQRGKVFEIKEDFASCYQVDEQMYRRLEPYIVIGEKYRLRPFGKRTYGESAGRSYERQHERPDTLPLTPFRLDTATVEYLSRIGFSRRQAQVLVSYRDMRGGLRDIDEVAECYVVSEEMVERLRPYLVFDTGERDSRLPVELNTADSAALRSVYGIGPKTVGPIMEYRSRLGGFCRVEQLAEVPGVTERNYELIVKQIRCDSCEIQKIDINFAPAEELAGHPYLPPPKLRKLLKIRQLKGGWSRIEEMIEDDIFTEDEAERIAPYLRF